ncbi:MAG: hypothetical protein IT585_01860 [candidate division Zixibacteria bacterium]|nr:hypothetical protein [candidate division Zixibacteria bacterium]
MKQIDLGRLKVRSIKGRHSKVHRSQFDLKLASAGVAEFVESLPEILKGADLKRLAAALVTAQRKKKPILWMFGAHVIKVGLAPLLCEMMQRGCVQMLSTNNAALIHDLELAFFGQTSEDVEAALAEGEFGMTQETCQHYAGVLAIARTEKTGLGEAAGRYINGRRAKYRQRSVFAVAQQLGIPATVHVAVGTDIVNAHDSYDGAVVGAASQIDFKIHCHHVTRLKNGGVALNFGSAVIMPEVFLKALAIARNLDPKFTRFTCANFDMIGLYRPRNNFVTRPRLLGATTFDFSGHHEIMLPLLWAAVRDRI